MKKKEPEFIKISWWYVSFGAAVLLLLWSLAPFLIQVVYRVFTMEEAGQVGDSYGAFNALVSSGAMIALVVSIYLQGQDLRTQSEMLAAQKDEMAATAKALKKQVKIASMTALLESSSRTISLKIKDFTENCKRKEPLPLDTVDRLDSSWDILSDDQSYDKNAWDCDVYFWEELIAKWEKGEDTVLSKDNGEPLLCVESKEPFSFKGKLGSVESNKLYSKKELDAGLVEAIRVREIGQESYSYLFQVLRDIKDSYELEGKYYWELGKMAEGEDV